MTTHEIAVSLVRPYGAAHMTSRFGRVALATVLLLIAGCMLSAGPAVAAGCSTGSSNSCDAPAASGSGPRALIGQAAPTTVGTNLTGSGTLDLASLRGKPTAVVFWLNTCPHCREALPGVVKLAANLGTDRQIVTGAIDLGAKGPKGFETPAAAVKTLGLTMPTVLVPDDVARNQWKIAQTPTVFLIDSGGTIRDVIVPNDPKQLAKLVDRALQKTS